MESAAEFIVDGCARAGLLPIAREATVGPNGRAGHIEAHVLRGAPRSVIDNPVDATGGPFDPTESSSVVRCIH